MTNGVYSDCKGNGGAEHSVSGVVCEDCWGVIGTGILTVRQSAYGAALISDDRLFKISLIQEIF